MRVMWGIAAFVALWMGPAWSQQPSAAPVTRAADLPPITVPTSYAPRTLFEGESGPLLALAEEAAKQAETQLQTFQIADNATRLLLIEVKKLPDYVRRDAAALRAKSLEQSALAQSPSDRLGLELALPAEITARCGQQDAGPALAEWLGRRLAAAPPEVAQPLARQLRSLYADSLSNPSAVRQEVILKALDTAARKAKGQWPGGLVQGLVRFRWEQECLESVAADLLKGVDAFLAGSASAAAPDIWQARSLTLEPGAAARLVRVAIWDTGVDLSLFKAAPGASFAFNGAGAITEGPLLKDVKGDDAALVQWLQGRADFLAGLPTPAADAYAAHVKALSAKEVEAFGKRLQSIASASHGTATASVALEGNPFAELVAVADQRIDFWKQEDIDKLDRRTAAYQAVFEKLRALGVRVVNFSWGLSPSLFEELLLRLKVSDPGARRSQGKQYFALEKAALDAAIRGAPDILFVAAAGNQRNDASFADLIPSGLSAPNLITVGAVDQAGRAAGFTTRGPTVVLFAKGVDTPVRLPGGMRSTLSGTSFAAPQVTNAAAKLFALKPELTPAEVRTLLLQTATTENGLPLLNAKAAAEALTQARDAK